eukprot:5705116-Pyramimonas_sp.AAC.1
MPRLDTYSANVAEGSGENLLAILGLRSMSNMRAILILEQGHEKMIIPGVEMYKVLLGEGCRALDLMKTPSGHLALKVDEYETAAEGQWSMSFWHHAQSSARRSPVTRQGSFLPRANCRDTCCARCPCIYDVARYEGHQLFCE